MALRVELTSMSLLTFCSTSVFFLFHPSVSVLTSRGTLTVFRLMLGLEKLQPQEPAAWFVCGREDAELVPETQQKAGLRQSPRESRSWSC